MPGAPGARLGRKRPLLTPPRGASSPSRGRGRGAQTFPFLPGQNSPARLDRSRHRPAEKSKIPRPGPLLAFSLLLCSLALALKRKRSPFCLGKRMWPVQIEEHAKTPQSIGRQSLSRPDGRQLPLHKGAFGARGSRYFYQNPQNAVTPAKGYFRAVGGPSYLIIICDKLPR